MSDIIICRQLKDYYPEATQYLIHHIISIGGISLALRDNGTSVSLCIFKSGRNRYFSRHLVRMLPFIDRAVHPIGQLTIYYDSFEERKNIFIRSE